MATSRGTVRLHQSAVAATSRQAGVVARRQLLAWGWTSQEIQGQVRAGRWRRLHRGVYWTATGPPPREAALWAAPLACGEGAVLCGRTAAELWGFGPESVSIFVGVPATRTTLRYGWTAVMSRPCDTAAQVGAVLASRGWAGRLRRCAPTCLVDRR